MIKQLQAFSHGQIQDALTILKIMKRESLTANDLKEYIKDIIFHPPKRTRRIKKKDREKEFRNVKFGPRGGNRRK